MRISLIQFFALLIGSFLLTSGPAFSREPDDNSITGRLQIEPHDVCLKIQVYLTNTTDKEVVVVAGYDRISRGVFPLFYSPKERSLTLLSAANWNAPLQYRGPAPELLTLQPGKEILYDSYLVPHPPADERGPGVGKEPPAAKMGAELFLNRGRTQEDGRKVTDGYHGYRVRFHPQEIPAPGNGANAEPKK
jgi:hypothetical protein